MRVLVTGATGYIGGRLIPRLVEAGHTVRVLVREADPVKGRPWERDVEVVQGDLLQPATLPAAVTEIDAAYYLVHSMYGGKDFESRDRVAAGNFVTACRETREAGVPHVIYLGGLEPKGEQTQSEHLRSRAEVGAILAQGLDRADRSTDGSEDAAHTETAWAAAGDTKKPLGGDGGRGGVTEFRAGPIIGSGSASFEMVRYLTERLPVMVTPRWVDTKVQPIAVRDVLSYLELALAVGPSGIVEIGTGVLSFKDMMLGVAAERGYRRWILPLPVLAPKLAARWVGLVTPIPNALAVPLVAGVTQDLIADTSKAEALFPEVTPMPYRDAVRLALTKIERGEVETRWSSAVVAGLREGMGQGEADELCTVIEDREGLARDQRTLVTDVPVGPMFTEVCSIGGENGWHVYRWAWWLRGVMDKLMGGPGLRRGRRHPTALLEGEALDWWRVDEMVKPRPAEETDPKGEHGHKGLLRLRAEMRVPGRAWLQWEVERRNEQAEATNEAGDEGGRGGRQAGGGGRCCGRRLCSSRGGCRGRCTGTHCCPPTGLFFQRCCGSLRSEHGHGGTPS